MTAYEVTSVLLGLLGLLGGALGFIRAVAADRRSAAAEAESADARSDAAAALQQSAAATERIAAAIELLAGRGKTASGVLPDDDPRHSVAAMLDARQVDWAVERRVPAHSYRLRNTGSAAAVGVTVLGASPSGQANLARVEPGTAVTFSVDPELHTRAIEVSWGEPGTEQSARRVLPLPRG